MTPRPTVERSTPHSEFISGELHAAPVLIKFIPALPKSLEAVVQLWRKGNLAEGFKPLRLYEKVEMRKELIQNYNNNMWSSIGQKNIFLRYKGIVELVSEFELVTNRDKEEDQDSVWDSAIKFFHNHFDRDGRPRALTNILRDAKTL